MIKEGGIKMDATMEQMETDEVIDDAVETDELYETPDTPDTVELDTFPVCDRCDCHAWQNGRCMALADNDFGSRSCPFYKNRDVNREEQKRCMERLIKTGRIELIKKYRKVLESFGLFDVTDAFADRVADELEQYSDDVLQELLGDGQETRASGTPESEEGDWDD